LGNGKQTAGAVDCLGNPVSGASREDLAAIDDFVGGLLAYQPRLLRVLDQAKVDRVAALVAVYKGVLHLLAETTGQEERARPWLAVARAAAARTGTTAREDRWIAVLDRWSAGDIDGTVAVLDDLLHHDPRDLAALKLLHYHHFNRGNFAEMLRGALAVQHAAGDLPYLGGMQAFAFEQLHLLDAAECAAARGLALVPDDPWAQHALAHVWLTRGHIDAGMADLTAWSPGWAGLTSFMVTHMWWHLALFHLARGQFDQALAIYDGHVWAHDRSYSQDQVGAVSLLARIELAGVDVGARWADLAPWLVARATDTTLPFLSVQYAYGLARAGCTQADSLIAAIAEQGADPVWGEAALPLAQGLIAQARRDHPRAAALLAEALPRLARLGGSHAQRDLFALVLIDAQINSGAFAAAQQALEVRRLHDPRSVPVNTALARVYDALGLPDLATAARACTTP
jgi:tetratricopeptide (TPR) repeat protein